MAARQDEILRLLPSLAFDKVFANRDHEPDGRSRCDSRVAQRLAEDGIGYEDPGPGGLRVTRCFTQTASLCVFHCSRTPGWKALDDFQVSSVCGVESTHARLAPRPAGETPAPGWRRHRLLRPPASPSWAATCLGMRAAASACSDDFAARVERQSARGFQRSGEGRRPSDPPHLRFGTVADPASSPPAPDARRRGSGRPGYRSPGLARLLPPDPVAPPGWWTVPIRPEQRRSLRWNDAPEPLRRLTGARRTGYPIVDAAMRQLDQTGWMHKLPP